MMESILQDFSFLANLSGGASLSFWKLQIREGLDIAFDYYEILKKKIAKIIEK